MAIRIQLRRDTAANWVSSNPVLRAGEVGIETDTLKFKIGNGSSTWTQITNYANVTSTGLSNSLNDYILASTLDTPNGPAKLNADGELLIPEDSIILWNDAEYTYTTKVIATQPTANRTITLPNNTGTVALTSDLVTTNVSEGTNLYYTDERAQDAVATALAAGTHTNISVSYNDNAGSISLTGAQTYSNEDAVDAVAAAIAAGTQTNISVTYDDANNSISFNASGGVSSLTGTANEVEVSASTGAITVGLPNDVTISNNLTVTGDIAAADSLQLTTNAAEGSATGKLIWDDGEGVPAIGLKGGNVDLKIGSQEVALCYNGTGSTIAKGSVVYISGAQGQRPRISLSDADTEATSSKTFGVVAESIADGAEGFVTTFGIVAGIDTSTFTAGDALWLSSTAGALTATKPSAPIHSVFVGYCLTAHASSGRIFVNPKNGYELEELHNVAISTVANDDVLKYDSTLGVWKNTKTLSITDLTLSGNLTVNGTTTTVNTSNLVVSDPLIYIGEGNTGNSVDLGFVSSFNNGTYQHSGLVRDASDNKWKLFKGVTDEPTSTINFAQGTLDALAVLSLEGNVTGNLTGNVTGNVTGNLTGNADTVTNGVYTTGSYADPSWITSLAKSKVGLGNVENTALSTWAGSTNITTLGTITTGTWTGTTIAIANGGTGATDAGTARTNLGLAIGTDVQAYNSTLAAVAGGTYTGDDSITTLGTVSAGTWSASTIATTKGGTGLTSYASGDILYASATDTLAKLAKGTDGQILTLASGVPSWAAAPITLPSQTGNAGYYLTTDGTNASWGALVVPITTGTATVTANTATTVDTVALSGFTSIEYMVSLKQGSKVRTSKVVVQTDGTSVDMTEFAITETGGQMTGVVVSATTSSTNSVLQVTVTDATSTNVDVKFSKVKL